VEADPMSSTSPRDDGRGATPTPPPRPADRPAVGAERLAGARPESTVTLMVQSGQAPGALAPGVASASAPGSAPGAAKQGWLARWWAVLKSRF
jgi:hypothetical protein